MTFEPLKRILHRSIAGSPAKATLEVARIFSAWDAALLGMWGHEKAAVVRPVSYTDGTLKIATASAAAKQMLEVEKERLKQETNRRLGAHAVAQIRVVWQA